MDVEALRPQMKNWAPLPKRLMIDLPNVIWLGAWERVENDRSRLHAFVSIDLHSDVEQGDWLHISVSRRTRLPTWGDLCKVRDEFGYGERLFVQLIPPQSKWLNFAGYTLHLLHRLDGETVPRRTYDVLGADGVAYGKPALFDGK